jgi:hypothetical protein
MGIGDMIDEAVRLYRQNWRLFLTIAAIGCVPVAIISVLYNLATVASVTQLDRSVSTFSNTANPSNAAISSMLGATSYICLAGLLFFIVSGVISILMVGAVTSAVAQRYLGRLVTIREAYVNARHGFWRILGVSVVIGIIIGVLYVIVAGGAVLGIGLGAAVNNMMICGTVSFVLVAALFAVAAYFLVRWSLVLQAIMIEGKGVFASMGRSSELVKGKWWRTFGIVIVGFLFFAVVGYLPTYLVQALLLTSSGALGVNATLAPITMTISTVTSMVFGILSAPIIPAVSTLVYYDLRIRKEGFDLEIMNQNLEHPEPTGI